MDDTDRRHLGRVFNEVSALYDRVRPTYPGELFADVVALTGMDARSSVLEVGCGTGQATRSLAALGCSVTAVEPRHGHGRARSQAALDLHERGGRDVVLRGVGRLRSAIRCPGGCVIVALGRPVDRLASSARRGPPRWIDGTARQRRRPPAGGARDVRRHRGSPRALLARQPRLGSSAPRGRGSRDGGGFGPPNDPGGLFGPTVVRWYPTVQWFDGEGFADLLRSTSLYRRLDSDVHDPLLDAIAERIRTRLGDRASRRYLSVLRVGQRAG